MSVKSEFLATNSKTQNQLLTGNATLKVIMKVAHLGVVQSV